MKCVLTIGIPVYNQVDTISATLDSVLAQTMPACEIVVSENHSTDGTAEIVARYADRVRIVCPERHLGMMANWNFCISQMKSEWFTLLSGDDLARPRFVEFVTAAIKWDDQVLVRGDWDLIDERGEVRTTHRLLGVRKLVTPPHTWIEQIRGPKVSFAAFAAKREAWERVGGFDERFYLFGDWAFWLALAEQGSFSHVSEVVSGYRIVERSMLDRGRALQRISDEHRLALHVFKKLPAGSLSVRRQLKNASAARFLDLLNHLVETGRPDLTEEAKKQLHELAENAGKEALWQSWLSNPVRINLGVVCRIREKLRKIARRITVRVVRR